MAAKDMAIGKRAKISKAQQYMIMAVFGASVMLGIALALIAHFVQQIGFNKDIIVAQDKSLVNYTKAIKSTGVCTKPSGDIYTDEELDKCNPNSITTSQVPNTLRSNILENMAENSSLNSVPKEANSICINPDNKERKNYTYEELEKIYNDAVESNNEKEISDATLLMQSCSALRIIPDALPAFRNEEALLASLNKLFLDSNWQPESLSPGGNSTAKKYKNGLQALSVSVSVEADTGTTMNVLHNIERSIREFDIERATIEWSGDNTLTLVANSTTAYYMDKSTIQETEQSIKPGGN